MISLHVFLLLLLVESAPQSARLEDIRASRHTFSRFLRASMQLYFATYVHQRRHWNFHDSSFVGCCCCCRCSCWCSKVDTQRMGKGLCSLCFNWNRYKYVRLVGRGGECKHEPIEHQRSWNCLAFKRCAQSDTLTKCWTQCCEPSSACESFTFNF